MMPALRGLLKSDNAVFLTTPSLVEKNTYLSSAKFLTGNTALIFSFGCICNKLTIGLPRDAREPWGISYTFTQYTRPLFEKQST